MGNPISIAFYDSGVGGLPYLKACQALVPGARYSYLADNAHFPLGQRRAEEICAVVVRLVTSLATKQGADIVVISCNTASVTALSELRRVLPHISFVGTVPAIKPAALESKTRRIALIATRRTIEDEYTDTLIREHAKNCQVVRVAAPEWVDFVELRLRESSDEQVREFVRPVVADLLSKGCDRIVLACTHFVYLSKAISEVAGDKAELVDSTSGVAHRVADIAARIGKAQDSIGDPPSFFLSAPCADGRLLSMARDMGFAEAGIIG